MLGGSDELDELELVLFKGLDGLDVLALLDRLDAAVGFHALDESAELAQLQGLVRLLVVFCSLVGFYSLVGWLIN